MSLKTLPYIERLHTAVDLDEFWKACLQLLHEVTPHHSCSLLYGIVNSDTLSARHHFPGLRAQGGALSRLSIAQPFLFRHPQVKLYTFNEVIHEDPSAQQLLLEQQLSNLFPWDKFIHLAFWDGPRVDAVLSIRRGPEQNTFTAEETEMLKSLYPIIAAGLERLRNLAKERSQRSSIERFVAGLPIPVLFLDSHFHLICGSQEGISVCAEWNFGQKIARSLNPRRSFKLPPEIHETAGRLIGRWIAREDGPTEERVPHPENPGLLARVSIDPQHRPSLWVQPVLRISFLVERNVDGVVLSSQRSSLPLLERLTSNERRIALLIKDGCSNRTIGERLSKSPRTVECQLTSIYKKLGVTNRVQLATVMA